MCGRMAQATVQAMWQVTDDLRQSQVQDHEPRYNIAPTAPIIVVRLQDGHLTPTVMRWGLVPSWWKDPHKLSGQIFNARAETLAEKPSFKAAYRRRRCIIPADGFYEWKTTGRTKQPYFIRPRDHGQVFLFAGLWELWETVDGAIESCTIITTQANTLMAEIHDRMPVILSTQDIPEWMEAGNEDIRKLQRLLVPCDPTGMEAYPVEPVRGEGIELIKPLSVQG